MLLVSVPSAAELGHWKLGHTPINFCMGQFIILANFLLFAAVRNTPGLYESFGFTQDRPALVAFLLFQFLMTPVDEVCRAAVVVKL
jgi:STE24 endopeptidase